MLDFNREDAEESVHDALLAMKVVLFPTFSSGYRFLYRSYPTLELLLMELEENLYGSVKEICAAVWY